MTINHDILKMYRRKEMITVCSFSYKAYIKSTSNTIEHLIGGKVIDYKPPFKNYKNYSHGLCEDCAETFYQYKGDKK